MTNHTIAHLLRNVAAALAIQNEKGYRFQIIAYQKAADSIEATSTQVSDLIKEGKLDDLPGIGLSIKLHLEELIKKGTSKHFDEIISKVPQAVFPLLSIPSFGPKKAYKLVTAFSLQNADTVIQDLEKKAKEGEVAGLESFGEKSQSDIIRAIQEFKEGKGKTTRMPLPFAQELAEKIIAYLLNSPSIKQAQPLGSLRRKVSTIGDIDIAVASDNPKDAVEHFVSYPYKDRVIEQGPTSASILTSGGQQVDFMIQPQESFGSLLQHFTGSKHHNVHLREFALKKGLSLSEYGIKKLKDPAETPRTHYKKEEDFYHAIGMDWIPPEIREDTGEIEAAIAHHLPKLVELKDLKGDLHIHSNYPIDPSHDLGKNTMEDMLKKAESLRYEYLAFSEHNPSLSTHSQKELETILSKRNDKIEQLKKSNKNIRIINLLETDILANGNIAINESCLEYVDAIIVSIHSSFSMDKENMTKRVLKGLSHPKAKILAHPTGRMFNQRPGYELDWEKVFDFCQKNNKALEINSWPQRLDLTDSLIRQAVGHTVKMVINTDSHATDHMDNMRYGVWTARRGWATAGDIVNTLSYNKFIEWLKK